MHAGTGGWGYNILVLIMDGAFSFDRQARWSSRRGGREAGHSSMWCVALATIVRLLRLRSSPRNSWQHLLEISQIFSTPWEPQILQAALNLINHYQVRAKKIL